MPSTGDIYFHKSFKFKDGAIGEKLFVVLNEPNLDRNEPYLVVKTTSQFQKENLKEGCNPALRGFFVPGKKEIFDLDTLIQLTDIYEFDAGALIRDGIDKFLFRKGTLTKLTITQIINCLKRLKEDISVKHFEMIMKSR
ncbi:MAG: hypothetical protein WBW16_10470 [Bacteroidota bacterium]